MAYELERLLDKLILSQLHPRSLISIIIQPIKLGTYPYASIVNACMAALIDAGIPLKSTVVAVSGVIKEDKISFNCEEELGTDSQPFMFIFDGHKEDNTHFCFEAFQPLSKERINELATLAKASSKEVFESLRFSISQRLRQKQ